MSQLSLCFGFIVAVLMSTAPFIFALPSDQRHFSNMHNNHLEEYGDDEVTNQIQANGSLRPLDQSSDSKAILTSCVPIEWASNEHGCSTDYELCGKPRPCIGRTGWRYPCCPAKSTQNTLDNNPVFILCSQLPWVNNKSYLRHCIKLFSKYFINPNY